MATGWATGGAGTPGGRPAGAKAGGRNTETQAGEGRSASTLNLPRNWALAGLRPGERQEGPRGVVPRGEGTARASRRGRLGGRTRSADAEGGSSSDQEAQGGWADRGRGDPAERWRTPSRRADKRTGREQIQGTLSSSNKAQRRGASRQEVWEQRPRGRRRVTSGRWAVVPSCYKPQGPGVMRKAGPVVMVGGAEGERKWFCPSHPC